MPKCSTFPILYDEAKQICISDLKKWGYLEGRNYKSGTISWKRNGRQTGWISIATNTISEDPYLELDYKYGDDPRKYKVPLVSISSNLRKGHIWFFLCPQTMKRCRKLYSVSGYFLHREAFQGCMYETQTLSKKNRQMKRQFDIAFNGDKACHQIHSKNFRSFYRGQPTKRFLKLWRQIKQSEEFNIDEVIKCYL